MPVIILHTRSTIHEPGKDRRAQEALWRDINAAVDEFEAKITALGGASETEHATKREPGKRDLTPPPPVTSGTAPVVDLVTLAEVREAVAEAAASVSSATPPARTRGAA